MKKIGLTLGKFAPLHKGHQYLIETALQEMDEVIVLVYDTPVTVVPLSVRAGWIRQLYPRASVVECWDGPDGYGGDREFEVLQEEYIFSVLGDKKVTHFYSSEYYGGHVSRALGGGGPPGGRGASGGAGVGYGDPRGPACAPPVHK